MELWRPLAQDFLDALLRRDGLGNSLYNTACSCCKATLDSGVRLFRYEQCGSFLQCEACVRDRHAVTPLHTVKVRGTLTVLTAVD
jgi:hypothetical protein